MPTEGQRTSKGGGKFRSMSKLALCSQPNSSFCKRGWTQEESPNSKGANRPNFKSNHDLNVDPQSHQPDYMLRIMPNRTPTYGPPVFGRGCECPINGFFTFVLYSTCVLYIYPLHSSFTIVPFYFLFTLVAFTVLHVYMCVCACIVRMCARMNVVRVCM